MMENIGNKGNWTNKGTDKQHVADSLIHSTSCVPNSKILSQVVAEKYLTKEKVRKRQKTIYFVYRGYKNIRPKKLNAHKYDKRIFIFFSLYPRKLKIFSFNQANALVKCFDYVCHGRRKIFLHFSYGFSRIIGKLRATAYVFTAIVRFL